ncbi:MAG: hypothetical protein ABJA67_18635 [Chthonomonadales bacterium]
MSNLKQKRAAKSESTISASVTEIGAIHDSLLNGFRELVEGQIKICTNWDCNDNWQRCMYGGIVEFDLMADVQDGIPIIAPRYGERSSCPVVRLSADRTLQSCGETPFVAWREGWKSSKDSSAPLFELMSASFTFFWGTGITPEMQIMRAEWYQPPHTSENAANPHWHIDWPLPVEEWMMSGIHLGMGDWEREPPWQMTCSDKQSLVAWAIHTLKYTRLQFQHFPLVAVRSDI